MYNRLPYFFHFCFGILHFFYPILVPEVSSLEFDGEADMDVSMNTMNESKQF